MLYDIGFLIFSIFYLPTLIFKGKLHSSFKERFGKYDDEKRTKLVAPGDKIWIQAVSVGEVALCKSLIPALKSRFPQSRIIISTITKTGNDLAKKLYSKDAVIIYFPLDFSFVVKKAAAIIRPNIYVMIETEIWPNLLKELSRQNVPSVLINGRISDRSFGKYKLVKGFLKNTLSEINAFCMQSETDASRIKELGAPAERVRVTGNMKFDSAPLTDASGISEEFFVAGSTHSGEEEIVLKVFSSLAKEFPGLKLLIAPRHIERAREVEAAAKESGLEAIRLSTLNEPLTANSQPKILILDTIGQLNDFYKKAAIVFIGGSLVKHGGQNPIEPAVIGKAVIFGPYMFNFKHVASVLLESEGALQVESEKELLERSRALLKDGRERKRMGENAKHAIMENRGATDRNLELIAASVK